MKFYSLFIFFKVYHCLIISSFSNVNIDQPNIHKYEACRDNIIYTLEAPLLI